MSLKSDVQNYKRCFAPSLEAMRDYYQRKEIVLNDAIYEGAQGIMPNGKMNSHQNRVGYKKCRLGAAELKAKTAALKRAKSFEEIFAITEEVRKAIHGLGHLWSYDTALRIGFHKRVYPTEVYVQSGVVDGVKKLNKHLKGRSLAMSAFPPELQKLTPYEVENFLCVWGKNKIKSC